MIKFFNNIIKRRKAEKLAEKFDVIEELIKNKNYLEAGRYLIGTINISEKVVNGKFYNLYKIYLLFLTKNYDEVIRLSKKVIDIIKQSKVDNKDTNDYYLLFVFTMVLISSVLIDDETKKKIAINGINSLDFEYKNVHRHELEMFPLFDADKLLEYFREEGEPKELNKEKLIYLLTTLNADET